MKIKFQAMTPKMYKAARHHLKRFKYPFSMGRIWHTGYIWKAFYIRVHRFSVYFGN